MKYELWKSKNYCSNVVDQVLSNRGIEYPFKYLTLTDDAILDYHLLDNIEQAAELLLDHIEKNTNIILIVDDDNDGITSSAMLYSYLHRICPDVKLNYIMHTRKSHGLSRDISIPENTNLVILVDAGTNDIDETNRLVEKGIDVICIDHHLQEKTGSKAIIVNNQCSNKYINKSLSGAGMCYQFLRCLDDLTWSNEADDFLDLAALGIIGDSMDIRTYENKRIIDKGLSQIKNKAFKAIIDKQSYSMNGEVTINNVAFYIAPLCNSIIRIGTQEEKDILFRAFIETDEVFDYQKRGEKEITKEDIYTRAARLGTNCRAKQNREVDKALEEMKVKIEKYKWADNKILFVDGSGIDGNFSGLAAMKLASMYNRPCVMFKEMSWKPGYFGGSGRNIDNSFIEDLRGFLNDTGYFDLVAGHSGAFGIECKKENVRPLIEKTNELLKDVSFDHVYHVDFILEPNELDIAFVQELDQLKKHYGQGISECLVALKNVLVRSSNISLMGKESDTWKFALNDDGVQVIKFKCDPNDKILENKKDSWQEQEFVLELICRVGINYFNQIFTPQAVVVDYNVINIKDL